MFLHLYPTFICKIYNDQLLKQIFPLSPITEERIATKYIHIQVNPIYDRLFQHKTLENFSLYHLLQKPETAEDYPKLLEIVQSVLRSVNTVNTKKKINLFAHYCMILHVTISAFFY